MTTKCVPLNRFFFAALTLATFTGAGMAATRITYDEIAKRLTGTDGILDHRGITITTTDGKTHSGRRLVVAADHLRIYHPDQTFEDLARDTVTPPVLAYTAATAPILLAADVVTFFIPAKVYEIVQ